MARTARIVRETSESHIELELNLDGTGKTDIDTSVPFYNHMMTALGKHSLIDLTIHAHGDTDIDVHHTVEDTAIVRSKPSPTWSGRCAVCRAWPQPHSGGVCSCPAYICSPFPTPVESICTLTTAQCTKTLRKQWSARFPFFCA